MQSHYLIANQPTSQPRIDRELFNRCVSNIWYSRYDCQTWTPSPSRFVRITSYALAKRTDGLWPDCDKHPHHRWFIVLRASPLSLLLNALTPSHFCLHTVKLTPACEVGRACRYLPAFSEISHLHTSWTRISCLHGFPWSSKSTRIRDPSKYKPYLTWESRVQTHHPHSSLYPWNLESESQRCPSTCRIQNNLHTCTFNPFNADIERLHCTAKSWPRHIRSPHAQNRTPDN